MRLDEATRSLESLQDGSTALQPTSFRPINAPPANTRALPIPASMPMSNNVHDTYITAANTAYSYSSFNATTYPNLMPAFEKILPDGSNGILYPKDLSKDSVLSEDRQLHTAIMYSYYASQLADLDISPWTTSISSAQAIHLLAHYLSTDHAVLCSFSTGLFLHGVRNPSSGCCSRFLVVATLFYSSVSFSSIEA